MTTTKNGKLPERNCVLPLIYSTVLMLKQLKKRKREVYSASLSCSICLMLFCGCSAIGESLHVNSSVLVKVPIDQPIETAVGKGWNFRHILEAPHDIERRGEWYVAWNENKPLRFGGLLFSWPKLFSRAPEIALATQQAFGEYPILIEPNRTFGRFAAKQPPEPQPGQPVPSQYGNGVKLVINSNAAPMKVWSDAVTPDPSRPGELLIDPMWHLDDDHSQLARARNNFVQPGDGIVIAHIDKWSRWPSLGRADAATTQ